MDSNGHGPRRASYRFVHASDLHLDAPIRGVVMPPEPLRTALRDASLRAWQSLVDLVIDRDAAFLILSGGLFDRDVATLRSRVAFCDALERLRAHAVEVFIALAPEDAAAVASLPVLASGATVFASGDISAANVRRDGECLATLRGTSCGADDAPQLVGNLRPLGSGLEIGVLPVTPAAGAGETPHAWATALLPRLGLPYWALGGSDTAAVLHENPWIVAPGTTQGRALEPAQLGPKGCMVVEVEDGRIGSVSPAMLDHVRFASVELDVSGCADSAAIRRQLMRELEHRVGAADGRVVVVEATLRGRMPARAAGGRLGFEGELVADLRRDAPGAAATAGGPSDAAHSNSGSAQWWVRVRDLTGRDEPPDAAGPWDLRRILTEHSEALSAPLSGSRFLAQTFAPLLRQCDAETDLVAQRELVRDAATLALDVLGAEGRR